MSVLVVADKIDYLISAQRKIQEHLNCPNDDIYYFCSCLDVGSDGNLPCDIAQRLIRVGDFLDGHAERYEVFRKETEVLYYKLCDRFNKIYSSCLVDFNLYDLSRCDIGALLMEFMRIYNFIKYLIESIEITQIVVLTKTSPKMVCDTEVYDYLCQLPIDTMISEVISKERGLQFVKISIPDNSHVGLSSFISVCKSKLKDYARSFYYLLSTATLFVKHVKSNANLLVFGSLNHLLPVLKEIKEFNILYYHPIPLIKITNILKQNSIKPVYKMGDTLLNRLKSVIFNLKVKKISKYQRPILKHDISRNLYSLLTFVFNEFCCFSIPLFSKRVDIYNTIFTKIVSKAILLDENVSSLRRPFEFAAQRKNIPTFVVNHGIPSKGDPVCLYKTISDFSYTFVGGQYLKDVFTNYYRANGDRIIVTGTPRYDDINKPGFFSKGPNHFSICLAPIFVLKRSITYNSLDYMISFRENLKVVIEKYKQAPFKFIVKFHPGDPREHFIRDMLDVEKVDAEYITDQKKSIDVLKNTDLVLTCWSQIALEGALLNKPVIMMNNYTRFPSPFDFEENKIGTFAQTPQDLSKLLDDYFLNKDTADFINLQDAKANSFEYEEFQDGGASKRAADFIFNKVNQKN